MVIETLYRDVSSMAAEGHGKQHPAAPFTSPDIAFTADSAEGAPLAIELYKSDRL